jgi:hypothetical protein
MAGRADTQSQGSGKDELNNRSALQGIRAGEPILIYMQAITYLQDCPADPNKITAGRGKSGRKMFR